MAPKPQPGKKGQVEQEDFSDVPTLPPLNFYIFALLFKEFFSQETREKVQKYVHEHLTADRVKTLTRDEIITFGKTKQIILEPNVAATLPQDDPRLKMNETEQLAKAAVDKLFEMTVHARRAKKEKIQKLEEEAKTQQQVDPKAVTALSQLDPDQLDIMFQLVDFPNTKAEALAFAKFNHNIHCIFEINQALKVFDTAEEQPFEQEQPPNELTESEQAAQKKVKDRLSQLLDARSSCVRNSSLRQMAVINCDFTNVPFIDFEVNEQGEEVEKRKEAEAIFSQEMNQKLEHYGALCIKYLRFKTKVALLPLFPDQEVKIILEQIAREDEEYKQWLLEVSHENTLGQSQKDGLDQAQMEEYQKQRSLHMKEIEEQKAIKAQELEERKKKMAYYREKLKVSVDDEFYIKNINLDKYKENFLPYPENQNSVSSIMSAMVSQIASESFYAELYEQSQEKEPEKESIDDLLNGFFSDCQFDLQREFRSDEDLNMSQDNYYPNRQKKQGTEAYASQSTLIGQVDYNEELDKNKSSIIKLPKQINQQDEDLAEEVCVREQGALENLVLPGLNRHMMPPIPSKSQRLRDAERPQLYPFSTLPVEDCERALILKAFQDLLKSNQIEEVLPNGQKHHKCMVFERIFEQHMNPKVLRQALAEALINDPDLATLYYPRNDSLLIALFNKMNNAEEGSQIDSFRQWRAAYRVMPEFENWIKYFSEEVVVPPPQTTHASGKPDQQLIQAPPKYQLDEEMIPETLLDIDDQKIQNIEEKSEMLYPHDGSIMKVDTYSIGGQTYKKTIVVKDNLKFGLRKCKEEAEVPDDQKEHGLVSYKKIGDTEFWMHFENDTKMLVESTKMVRNPQKLIRIDPPKPTPEEIAAREEAIKQAQAAAAKQKGKAGSALANQPPVIEEYKEPEPTWEPEPLNFLDTLFSEEEFDFVQKTTTTTFPNGLIVQHMTDGNVIQLNEKQINDSSIEEKDRVFLYNSSGVVVRHLKSRDAEVLFPSGVKAEFNKKDMMWVITNNKGIRTATKNGISWDLDPIPCAYETDAVTNAKMMVREDKVMTIEFKDGSFYCQHSDGTMMKTNANKTEVRIEKDGYAPVVIKRIIEKSQAFYEGRSWTPEDRCLDSYIMETHMPDGTISQTFTDIISGIEKGMRIVFIRPDFSVISLDEHGYIKILSSNARNALNESNGKTLMGKDIDWCKAVMDQENTQENSNGMYTCILSHQPLTSTIFTGDDPVNCKMKYILCPDFTLMKYMNENAANNESPFENLEEQQADAYLDGREIENVGTYKDPFTKHYIYPRLFVIKNDGSGYELLAKEQLEYYFRTMKYNSEALKQRNIVMIGNSSAKTHYFVSKVKTLEQRELEMTLLKTLDFPQNAHYALLHSKPQTKKKEGFYYALPDQYLVRQIFEFQEFEPFKQDAFYDDLYRFKQWRISQVRYDAEFGIVHVPPKDQQLDYKKIEDDEYFSKRIISKILKERRNKRQQFNPEEHKRNFVGGMNQNEEINQYQRRITYNLDKNDDSMWKGSSNAKGDSSDHLPPPRYDKFGHQIIPENLSVDKIRNIKKKQETNIVNQLQDIRRMINTPIFIPSYFQSKAGQLFTKNNPEKPPSQEMIMRMSQRINRSQNNTEKAGQSHYEGSQRSHKDNSPLNANPGEAAQQQQQQDGEDKESPIVALEPEDNLKQGSAFMKGTQGRTNQGPGGLATSLYIQEKMYLKQREQETLLKAEEYHVVKTKDFNVIGRLRQEKPVVKVLAKSNAQSELNEKFITTECIADRRVKISSMAPRQYINAPSVEDVRKQGQHQMILSAINKKQTFAELINQANAMVTSVLHDPLKRSFNVMPSVLKFGTIQAGQPYELIITMKNEDQIGQRAIVKPMEDKRILVQQIDTGPIAPGMIKKVSVTILCHDECTIKETLQILCKTDVFKVPIEANILSPENFQKELQEQKALNGKNLTNSRVRNKLNQSIQKGRMSAKGEREVSIEGDDGPGSGIGMPKPGGQVWETTNSESRLPQIPQVGKRPFEVDSKKNLQDLLKK